MNIAFLVSIFPKLSETFILNQITGLLDLGHDVRIFSECINTKEGKVHPDVARYGLMDRLSYFVTPENWAARSASGLGLVVRNFHKSPRDIFASLNFVKLGKKACSLKVLHLLAPFLGRRFDIIHSHFGINGALAVYLKQMGVPGRYITSFHGYDINTVPFEAGPHFYDHLFRHGDLFTANTNFTKKRLTDLGCPDGKIKLLPVGFDISKFRPGVRRLAPGEPLRLLTIGRLVGKKGHEFSLKALKILLEKGVDAQYTIAGNGPEKDRLVGLASALGLSGKVKFMDDVREDEVIELYRNNHIFVLPSVTTKDQDREGQALVLQEAQATGMPVVSTWHNGIPEGVLDKKSGFLVPERDPAALAERIEFLRTNSRSWKRMGEAGRAFVEKKYDIKTLNRSLVEIYEGLLSEGQTESGLKAARMGA